MPQGLRPPANDVANPLPKVLPSSCQTLRKGSQTFSQTVRCAVGRMPAWIGHTFVLVPSATSTDSSCSKDRCGQGVRGAISSTAWEATPCQKEQTVERARRGSSVVLQDTTQAGKQSTMRWNTLHQIEGDFGWIGDRGAKSNTTI